MKEVIDANGCMVVSDEDISVIVIKKTGNLSMRDALNRAIDLLRTET